MSKSISRLIFILLNRCGVFRLKLQMEVSNLACENLAIKYVK